MGAILRAIGTYFPERILTNQDLEKILAASGQSTSDEWITQRTGMKTRRIAAENESNLSMAVNALEDALDGTHVLECIIVATNTSAENFPSAGSFVQGDLVARLPGLVKRYAGFFDLGSGCGGINYALMTADALIERGVFDTVAVVGVEHLSSVVNYSDRETCVLFGDGASAYVLSGRDHNAGFMGHYPRGDGSMRDAIKCLENQEKVTFYEALRSVEEGRKPIVTRGRVMKMDGKKVFKYVQSEWYDLLGGLKNNKKLNPEGIDFDGLTGISPHLANYRNLETVDKKYPGFLEKCGLNGNGDNIDFCNTSTASQGKRSREFILTAAGGQYLLMFGYGAGVTSCANLYKQPFREL